MPDEIVPSKKAKTPGLLKQARGAFKDGATGVATRQDVEAARVGARRGAGNAAPMLMEAAIDKALKGRGSPFDSKMLQFLLNATGVAQTGAPITEAERRAQDAENERLNATPVAELAEKVNRLAGITPVPEPEA